MVPELLAMVADDEPVDVVAPVSGLRVGVLSDIFGVAFASVLAGEVVPL